MLNVPSNLASLSLSILYRPKGTFYKDACALILVVPLFVMGVKKIVLADLDFHGIQVKKKVCTIDLNIHRDTPYLKAKPYIRL